MAKKDYIEDVGDVLAPYRHRLPQGVIVSQENPDPFSDDPDWKQFQRDEKLKSGAVNTKKTTNDEEK